MELWFRTRRNKESRLNKVDNAGLYKLCIKVAITKRTLQARSGIRGEFLCIILVRSASGEQQQHYLACVKMDLDRGDSNGRTVKFQLLMYQANDETLPGE